MQPWISYQKPEQPCVGCNCMMQHIPPNEEYLFKKKKCCEKYKKKGKRCKKCPGRVD